MIRYLLPGVLFLVCAGSQSLGQSVSGQSVSGLKLMPGFKATKVASDEMVSNIYSITLGPQKGPQKGPKKSGAKQELFVAGPGYIKALSDQDGDGVFESSRVFANGPKSGAQGGVAFDGNDLLCTGDGALLRFVDADGDGVADGAPEEILKIKTGGEHHAHGIRKGPDGWWYLLSGNEVPILPEYYAGQNSPVKKPRAGFLMRISPDWKTKEIHSHGFRNAYDFDFNSLGQVFVYDSDGERDITLPWYRPTRLFRMRPGDDAGFVARGWKRPSYFYDMPIEIGALGRGSPTGVVNCQSKSYPTSFYDSIFVADWTFGRVVAFRRGEDGTYDRGTDFAIAKEQFGFAVTDLEFDSDGSLLVSVGGRGTEGAIYRIEYVGDEKRFGESDRDPSVEDAFIFLANSRQLSVEILIGAVAGSNQPIRIAAFEALVGNNDALLKAIKNNPNLKTNLIDGLKKAMATRDPKLILPCLSVAQVLDEDSVNKLAGSGESFDPLIKQLLDCQENRDDSTREAIAAVSVTASRLESGGEEELLAFARIGQLLLGDCKSEKVEPMFVGFTASDKPNFDSGLQTFIARSMASVIENTSKEKQSRVAEEYGRLVAMLGIHSPELLHQMAAMLDQNESPVPNDIHWLICLCQSLGERSSGFEDPDIQTKIATSLIGINEKIKQQGLVTDRNFYPRMQSLASRLFKRDPAIAKLVAEKFSGNGNDVFLFEALPNELKNVAVAKIAKKVQQDPDSASLAQLNVLSRHPSGAYLPLVRTFNNRREFLGTVVGATSASPLPVDRPLFIRGLNSADLTTMKKSAIGLRRIFDGERASEAVAAYKALAGLGWDKPSVSVRDQLMMLIEKHTEEQFDYRQRQGKLDQRTSVKAAGNWMKSNYRDEFKVALQNDQSVSVAETIASVDWGKGNAERGKNVYRRLQCAQCHDGGSRLGPRLAGLSKRFSRDDVLAAIMLPNQQVPMRYRALKVETVEGLLYTGSVIYESVDGITLQLTNGSTVRVNKADIESRVLSPKSLMPVGLLKNASNEEVADLMAYLQGL